MVDVDIKCPCGAHLGTTKANEKGTSKRRWTTTCRSCKKTIVCELVGARIFTSIKQ